MSASADKSLKLWQIPGQGKPGQAASLDGAGAAEEAGEASSSSSSSAPPPECVGTIGVGLGHRQAVLALAAFDARAFCSSDGDEERFMLASGSADMLIKVWEWDAESRSLRCACSLKGHSSSVTSLATLTRSRTTRTNKHEAASACCALLVSGSADLSIKVRRRNEHTLRSRTCAPCVAGLYNCTPPRPHTCCHTARLVYYGSAPIRTI